MTGSSPWGAPPRSPPLRGPDTRWIELGGRFVAPGFIDNHTHFDRAGELILGVNLLDVADEASLARREQRLAEARAALAQLRSFGVTTIHDITSAEQLAAGKLADLVVLDRDPFTVPPAQIKDLKVMMTVVGGEVVYEAKEN